MFTEVLRLDLSVDSMKALDLVTMKKLDSKVNIIPVIAKADTITKTELQKFKSKVCFQVKIHTLLNFYGILVVPVEQ